MAVTILGVPVDAGAGQRGATMGPTALRIAGVVETLQSLGLQVDDQGDLPIPYPLHGGEVSRELCVGTGGWHGDALPHSC